MSFDLVAKDVREQLRRWDAGESIRTVEMGGGIGPGYEQAIQVLAIEIVRDNLDKPLPPDGDKAAWREFGMATAERIDVKGPDGKYSCGFSGAQFGAACNLAARWLRIGPAAVHAEVPRGRRIQASRFWPHAPVAESTSAADSRAPQSESGKP